MISRCALRTLREANAVICEERRDGARLLSHYQIQKELIELNEHTEQEATPELIARLQRSETLALISDHGTPLLADPGGRLVGQAIAHDLPVSAIPGVQFAGCACREWLANGTLSPRRFFVG
jgi:16S rRNA (cytidine1402-2'-O)-methyltransferase